MPGQRLTLAREGKVELREAARKLFVVLAATALILAITAGAEQAGRTFTWVMAPVILLLMVVVFFGLLALWRSARRATAGTHLAIDTVAGVVSGFTAQQTVGRMRLEPLSSLKALTLTVRRGTGTSAREPKSCSCRSPASCPA